MSNAPRLEAIFCSAEDALESSSGTLVDLVDGLLEHGVVLHGEVWLTVADIDLVYLGLSAILTTPEKILTQEDYP